MRGDMTLGLGEWRGRHVWIGTSLVATGVGAALGVGACNDDRDCGVEQTPPIGTFQDSPRPTLCPSDTLVLTPMFAAIGGASTSGTPAGEGGVAGSAAAGVDGGTGGSSLDGGQGAASTANFVQMALIGRRATGQPHESAHVDVTTCNSASHLVTLTPTLDSNLAGGCTTVSDYFLTCILDANGLATFRATAIPGMNGQDQICARSGPQSQQASVHVGVEPVTLQSVVFLSDPTASLVDQPAPMACGSAPPASVACANLTSRAITLEAESTSFPGDAGGGPDGSSFPATPSGPVTARLSVIPKSGATTVWLSTTNTCHDRLLSAPASFDGTGPLSATAYLCSDGSQGTVSVIATYPSRGASGISMMDFTLPQVPAIVQAGAPGGGGLADGGTPRAGTASLVARDCRGTPIAGASVALATGAAGTTDPLGTVTLTYPVSDGGGTVTSVFVTNPGLLGAPSGCSSIVLGGGGQ